MVTGATSRTCADRSCASPLRTACMHGCRQCKPAAPTRSRGSATHCKHARQRSACDLHESSLLRPRCIRGSAMHAVKQARQCTASDLHDSSFELAAPPMRLRQRHALQNAGGKAEHAVKGKRAANP